MRKLCPKIVLEGSRLTPKTEIAFALNENPSIVGPRRYRYHSPIISAEQCGFSSNPWGRGLVDCESPPGGTGPGDNWRALCTGGACMSSTEA